MFERFSDLWSTRISGNTDILRYKEIVNIFRLKYPSVQVDFADSGEFVPNAFLVSRSDGGKYNIVIGKSKQRIFKFLLYVYPEYSFLATEPWRQRNAALMSELFPNNGHGFVPLNWGIFSYSCSGLGEFAASGYGRNGSFIDDFVLKEDREGMLSRMVSI